MTSVLLYWNHICVLHKQEKIFLEQLADRLWQEKIDLKVRYFGLGYPEHMSEYLARPDATLPDVIVSADLEVFEDNRIFGKFSGELHPAAEWIPLRKEPAFDAACRSRNLLPFLSIPLVYYTCAPPLCAGKNICDVKNLAFGGINNSAGKTLIKAVWSRYGKEAAVRLLQEGDISDMPVGAFQQVRKGYQNTALVPSLYALRADGAKTILQIPNEGPLLVSSYFCARQSIPLQVARRLAEAILCPDLCGFYANNGDLIVHPACTTQPSQQEGDFYFTPDSGWYERVSPEEFYDLYCEAIPSAKKPLL